MSLERKGDKLPVYVVESPVTPGALLEWPGPVRLMMLGAGGGLNIAVFLTPESASQFATESVTKGGRVVQLALSR